MSGTATVTGVTGPGKAVTAQAYTSLTRFEVDTDNRMVVLTYSNGKRQEVSIAAATTFTVTMSGNFFTVTIS